MPMRRRMRQFSNIQNRFAMDTLRIPAKLESWETIRTFVFDKVERFSVDQEIAFKVELVLEELVVNVISYAYPGGDGDLEICCDMEDRAGLRISIRDWGEPFNPLERESPDISQDISERQVGGLGVFLVRQMVDRIDYVPVEGGNMLVVRFDL